MHDEWTAPEPAGNSPPAAPPQRNPGRNICTQCGTVGNPKMVPPGSLLVEIGLWICFLVPGLIYSLWRVGSKRPTCRRCGAVNSLVPLDSPRGLELAEMSGKWRHPPR